MGSGQRAERLDGPVLAPDKTRTAFLDIARGLAALLVVYTHIYDVFIRDHKDVRTPPTDVVDNAVVLPLKLDEQGIGAVAVPIFFVISGFVVTPIALRMGPGRFSVNRAFRIYPLLIFVVAITAVLMAFGHLGLGTNPPEVTVGTVLSNLTLWNFIDRPFGSWVGVAWTLAVEVLFYAMLIAVLPLLRKRTWLAIAVQLEFILILLVSYQAFGDEYRAFVINMVYTLIPIMGQVVWAAWTGRIRAWLAGVYLTVAWLIFVWSGHLDVDPNYIPRPFPVALALMLFMIGLLAEPYLRERRFWTELSERTYSIYLLHGSVAFPLMHLTFNTLPLWLTVLIAVVATGIAVELSYRFVERPSHDLARRLSRRGTSHAGDRARKPDPDDGREEVRDGDRAGTEEPTEKTPPVAPPRRRPVPPPGPRRPPVPVEVETEKFEPVSRPRPAQEDRPARPAPPVRPAAGTGARPVPEDGITALPIRTGGRRRADEQNGTPPRRWQGEEDPRRPRAAPAGPRQWPDGEQNGRPGGRRHRPEEPVAPAPNGHRFPEPAPNRSRHEPERDQPFQHNGTRRRVEDLVDGQPWVNGTGGRRRAEDRVPGAATNNGAHRVEPSPASAPWPGEGDDPDEARPNRGRHHVDPTPPARGPAG